LIVVDSGTESGYPRSTMTRKEAALTVLKRVCSKDQAQRIADILSENDKDHTSPGE